MGKYTICATKHCQYFYSILRKRLSQVDNFDKSWPVLAWVPCFRVRRLTISLKFIVGCDTQPGPGPCEIVVKSIRVGSISDKKSRRVAHQTSESSSQDRDAWLPQSPAVCSHILKLTPTIVMNIMQLDYFARDTRLQTRHWELCLHN